MKCPKCNSVDVLGRVLASGFTNVDMQTGELMEDPEDCDYDINDLTEFLCQECGHEWDGEIKDETIDTWFYNRAKEREEIHRKFFGPIGEKTPIKCYGKGIKLK